MLIHQIVSSEHIWYANLKDKTIKKIHQIQRFIEVPELIIKIMDLAIRWLNSNVSLLEIKVAKICLREIKDYTCLIKSLGSFESLLNIKCTLKSVTMVFSGLSLFTINVINISEKFKISYAKKIKSAFSKISYLGELPFGGIFNVSLASLLGILFLNGLEKNKQLIKKEKYIAKKAFFWSHPISELQINKKLETYMIQKKALLPEKTQKKIERKIAEWNLYNKNKDEFSTFKNIQAMKWHLRLEKIRMKKKSNLLLMGKNLLGIVQNVIIIGNTLLGNSTPAWTSQFFAFCDAALGVSNYFLKRKLQQINTKKFSFNVLLKDDDSIISLQTVPTH